MLTNSSIDKKEDLRITKTKRALYNALFSLLGRYRFEKLTVNDICDEALVSRATFYAHFRDKYDFLRDWLIHLSLENMIQDAAYEQIEKKVNEYIHEHELVISNLLYDAGHEVLSTLFDFILSTLRLTVDKDDNKERYTKSVVLANFYAGGIIYYLLWQIRNRFPSDVAPMNIYLYDMISKFET